MGEAIDYISQFFPALKSILDCFPDGVMSFFASVFTLILIVGVALTIIRTL